MITILQHYSFFIVLIFQNLFNMNFRRIALLILLLFSVVSVLLAQSIKWMEVAGDVSFFNEYIGVDTESGTVLQTRTIDSGVPINKNLIIDCASSVIDGTSSLISYVERYVYFQSTELMR